MRALKWLAGLLVVLVLLAGAAWLNRKALLLHVPALVRKLGHPVASNRPVVFERGPEMPALPPSERPPNIVVILADDMGFNDVTLHGGGVANGSVPTPHIDGLAAQGVQFTAGYAGNAVCAPSRAMILTGRYSTRFGFEFTPAPKGMALLAGIFYEDSPLLRRPIVDRETARSMPPMTELGMPGSEITLAELLKTRGYHTIHIGKWHLGRSQESRPRSQGFDESLLMESGLYLPVDHPDARNSRQDFDAIDAFLWANMQYAVRYNEGPAFEPDGYLTDYFTDQAVAAIEANRNRPFFLYLAHWAPHTPLQALRQDYDALAHIEDHRLRVYAAMVRAVDRSVGRVLAALDEQGLAGNTLVFFTSDNGGANYVGLPDLNRPYRGWKLTLFEGGTHVPFVARWPGRIPEAMRYEAPVSHLDLYATAAAAAGAALPDDRAIDGVDLLPYLRGEARGDPHAALFWREGYYRSVLAGGWKLQVCGKLGREWLYHLSADPTERHDLSRQRPDKVAELRALLTAHDAEQAEPLWPSFIDLPVSVDRTLAEPESPDDEFVYWPN